MSRIRYKYRKPVPRQQEFPLPDALSVHSVVGVWTFDVGRLIVHVISDEPDSLHPVLGELAAYDAFLSVRESRA
jgi:hypothetical protein